jgi:hypothetical protein
MQTKFLLLAATATTIAAGAAAQIASGFLAIPTLPAPDQFVAQIDNPWFPLRPGTTYTYHGVKDGQPAVDVLTVTRRKRKIVGINATVIDDRLYLSGHLGEHTTDWYAQDKQGNVWYLGERTATLDAHGKVTSTDGTWVAGTNNEHPGIYMPAHPKPGDAARQEFYKRHAEDQFKVLSPNAAVTTPGASSRHALLTQETTQLEPGVVDHKLYVRGVGTVLEVTVKGGNERLVLSSVKR